MRDSLDSYMAPQPGQASYSYSLTSTLHAILLSAPFFFFYCKPHDNDNLHIFCLFSTINTVILLVHSLCIYCYIYTVGSCVYLSNYSIIYCFLFLSYCTVSASTQCYISLHVVCLWLCMWQTFLFLTLELGALEQNRGLQDQDSKPLESYAGLTHTSAETPFFCPHATGINNAICLIKQGSVCVLVCVYEANWDVSACPAGAPPDNPLFGFRQPLPLSWTCLLHLAGSWTVSFIHHQQWPRTSMQRVTRQ